jgi:hypothetical protein
MAFRYKSHIVRLLLILTIDIFDVIVILHPLINEFDEKKDI